MWKKENLRKNFLRVKQIADQNLGRAEKTEVLSNDLLTVERRVEQVRQACQLTSKKLALSLQGIGLDIEKRLKKLPETGIAHTMIESANLLGVDMLLGSIFKMCGECQHSLAKELLQYELDVENTVLQPLQSIQENDIPTVMKLRKHLNKLTLDMDSARNRWAAAMRQSQVHGANMAAVAAKADTIRGEMEEASNRVELAKDALATEMLHLIAKDSEHGQTLVALLEAQANYHKNALETISKIIPQVTQQIQTNPNKPVYGMSLEHHLKISDRSIALVIEACVCTLLDTGVEEEGIFRVAGMASKMKKLKASFDAGIIEMEDYEKDLHTVAGAMKQYLRELPEPLLTFALYKEFIQAMQLSPEQRLPVLCATINKLPKPNYDNFRYLVKFLAKIADKSEVNKMTPSNIAIVIGPNLLWSSEENAPNMLTTSNLSAIIEVVVNNADVIFPGEIDFNVTKSFMGGATLPNPKDQVSDPLSSHPTHRRSPSWQHGLSAGSTTTAAAESELLLSSAQQDEAKDDLRSALAADEPETSPQGEGEIVNPLECCSPAKATTNPVLEFPAQKAAIKTSRSRSVPPAPVSKSFHSDVYDTVFALQSLGDGTWPDYLTKVRAMWDDQFHARPPAASSRSHPSMGVTGSQMSLQEIDFRGSGSSAGSPSSSCSQSESVAAVSNSATVGSTLSASQPAIQTFTLPLNNNVMASSLSVNLPPEIDPSPKTQRKLLKKPAPPPPPERPHSVAVSSSVSKLSQSQTWPRQNALGSQGDAATSTQDFSEKTKTLLPERPHPLLDRRSGPPPERPKGPPPVIPHSGHQRSASTGGQDNFGGGEPITAGQGTRDVETTNKEVGPALTSQQQAADKLSNSNSFNRQGSARMARPTPPPPPPPPVNKSTEDTRL